MAMFSPNAQLSRIRNVLSEYTRLPFSNETIPGAVMEGVLAEMRGGDVLKTYDFVDVIKPSEKAGWQLKSTRLRTH